MEAHHENTQTDYYLQFYWYRNRFFNELFHSHLLFPLFSSVSQATAVQLFIFALLGVLQGFASSLFKNEKLSLLTTSLIHYLFIVLPLLLAGSYLHWFYMTRKYFVFSFLLVSIIYILIYLFCYFENKKNIQKINKKLHQI